MNCPTCHNPTLVLFPGGHCPRCRGDQPAPKAKPVYQRDRTRAPLPNRPRIYCSTIPPEEYHQCVACPTIITPREGEYPSHYRRRRTCCTKCASTAISAAQLGRWKTAPARSG